MLHDFSCTTPRCYKDVYVNSFFPGTARLFNSLYLECLELLDKLQKRICRTVDPSLATSLQPLAHRQNVASLSLFYRYYFGRCSSELAQLVPFPFSRGKSTRSSDRLYDFSVIIPRCCQDVYVNSIFPGTARLWNLNAFL